MERKTIRDRIEDMLEAYGQQSRLLGLLAFVSVLLSINVALMVSQVGLTKTTPQTVLECHYAGNGAHTHNRDCYDASGTLVCPLEVRELHTHDDSCYTEERLLACGLEESDEHAHNDDCYKVVRTLTCGKEEITEEHVHGPGCFITINVPVTDDEADVLAGEQGVVTGAGDGDVAMPAQEFSEDLTKKDAEGNEQVVMTVLVKAPEGAFPAGTTMQVKPVTGDIDDMVDEAVKSDLEDEDVKVTRVTAVDITFFDAGGNEIEPIRQVEVKLVSDIVRDMANPMLVHVDNKKDGAKVIKDTARVNRDDDDSSVGNEDTLRFTAERFSPYVLVEVEQQDKEQKGKESDDAKASDDGLSPISPIDIIESGGGEERTPGAQTFTGEVGGISIVAKAPEGAFLLDAEMRVEAVDDQSVEEAVVSAVDGMVEQVVAVDIAFYDEDGNVVQPQLPVEVSMTNENAPIDGDAMVVHVDGAGEAEVVDQTLITSGNDRVFFDAEDAAIYAMVVTRLEQTLTSSDGNTYQVSVTYDESAGIPHGATLDVHEIVQQAGGTAYEDYLSMTENALGCEEGALSYVRFFDITILDAEGRKVQPADGSVVDVDVHLYDRQVGVEPQVVHFADAAGDGEVLSAQSDGNTVKFEATGFSVYAIVEAPEAATVEVRRVADLAELATSVDEAFYLSLSGNKTYFSSSLNGKNCLIEGDLTSAAEWFFEPVYGAQNRYRLYTMVDGEQKYLKQKSGNDVELANQGTDFDLSQAADGMFYFKAATQNRWLQHSGSGGGIRFYTDKNNAANSRIIISYASSYALPDDPYGLDGKVYGIAYNDESATAAALGTGAKTVSSTSRLEGKDLLIRPDVLDNSGLLLVAQNSNITEWTFENVQRDDYYLKTTVGGQVKYLTIKGANVTLADEPDGAYSLIKAVPGSGEQSGKWHFTANGYSLNLPGNTDGGFGGATGMAATTWMNLVEKSVLNDDDFNLYNARKVSVSDTENMHDGQQVVIYTRIWNDTRKCYEFYVVDHDGTLVRCYDVGDGVEWIGSVVNTALWDFTEYLENGSPNFYYELQSVQYGNYIAPQMTGSQVMSDKKLGINLNGRRYGEGYTTIIAWDDNNYAYVGLKTENGRVVACPLSEAEDFYFAVVSPVAQESELTTVETIDNSRFGITMKMMDFDDGKPNTNNHRNAQQTALLGNGTDTTGLVSSDLKSDGYPVTNTSKTGKPSASLQTLFSDMQDVNHLFIESIYNESGYFEFNSTQNYAYLDGSDFTVYDQLGTIDPKAGARSPWHGQFLPYNTLIDPDTGEPWPYSTTYTNQTSTLNQELPDTDPRKGEGLHEIPYPLINYFFGMEMEASFTQTASGLDAWGHDIIFEFSGDDDFWFYVDGELVLDLGGIHSAMTGSINFRTGEVKSSRGNSTLYQIFKSNFQARGMTATEVEGKLAEIFEKNSAGQYVFKDYSNHTMKMFYMERGAGASNLHMRFNLAAVKPGTFVLSKKLSGTESATNKLLEFPYQVYYTLKNDGGHTVYRMGEKTDDVYNATYVGTSNHVKYAETFTPAGGSKAYEDVFFLKPGELAEFALPDDVAEYRVVECGVNPDIYDHVYVNGSEVSGTTTQNGSRLDFATADAALADRSQVDYVNHVSEGAMRTLSITKRLYAEDGETRLHYTDSDPKLVDKTTFNFRLYLGNENAPDDDIPLADMYTYYVKDRSGEYCTWDAGHQRFVSLGKNDFAALSAEEKELASFTTSMNGSISKIPADYTVEVHDLIIDSKFMVEERSNEIPKGYTLRLGDGYTRTDTDPNIHQYKPLSGVIEKDADPKIQVRNQKGWGLTVEKVWTDADFMKSHDDIYFAVYLRGKDDELELVEGTVRCLRSPETSVYYFFDRLGSERKFEEYVVREVMLEGDVTVAKDGEASGYASIEPIEDGGTLTVGGTPVGGTHQDGYAYKVGYEQGEQTERNENVRVDTVTNSRPGIKLYKQDWSGNVLAGATFTLTDAEGNNVAASSYTSRDDGLITIAYLSAGTYILKETGTPQGFVAMADPMTITVDADGAIEVSGVDESYYEVDTQDGSMTATVTIKNRPTGLQVKKIDASTKDPIPLVHFALYRQVTDIDGTPRKDWLPMSGYADLVTNESGVLTEINMSLGVGTYYLTETQAADGYAPLSEDLRLTIGSDGTVTVDDDHRDWLTDVQNPNTGEVSYVIAIPNGSLKRVAIKKVCMGSDTVLEGASFALYDAADFDDEAGAPVSGAKPLSQGSTGKNGLLKVGELVNGAEYRLVETTAPDGYLQLESPIKIFVESERVTASLGNNTLDIEQIENEATGDVTWQIVVWNNPGVLLPKSGGPGILWLQAMGLLLVVAGGIALGCARMFRSRIDLA